VHLRWVCQGTVLRDARVNCQALSTVTDLRVTSLFSIEMTYYATSCATAPDTVIRRFTIDVNSTHYEASPLVAIATNSVTTVTAVFPGLTSTAFKPGEEVTVVVALP
jgi:hypothetical protein